MKSASSVKGINRIAVVVVIIIMLIGGWMSRQLLELQKAAERVCKHEHKPDSGLYL
jgi:type III secretory pathway component EscS